VLLLFLATALGWIFRVPIESGRCAFWPHHVLPQLTVAALP
jgi:hypothetical protein